ELLLRQQVLPLGQRLLGREAEERVFLRGAAAAPGREEDGGGEAGERGVQMGTSHKGFSEPASRRSSSIRSKGSDVAKMAEPTTQVSTPAATTDPMLSRSIPPSISISTSRPALSINACKRRALSRAWGRKACPPNPGLTDIKSTKSRRGRESTRSSTGVEGFKTTPGAAPRSRMRPSRRSRWTLASQWTAP